MTKHDLERVHKALIDAFVKRDDRFLDSIVYLCNVKGKSKNCFFPVENSVSKSEWYNIVFLFCMCMHVTVTHV